MFVLCINLATLGRETKMPLPLSLSGWQDDERPPQIIVYQ